MNSLNMKVIHVVRIGNTNYDWNYIRLLLFLTKLGVAKKQAEEVKRMSDKLSWLRDRIHGSI